MGVVEGKSAVTPWVSFDSNQAWLDLKNEVQYVSDFPLDQKIPAVKVERSKKNVYSSSKTDVFFDRSTLTAGIFGSSESSETYFTSFLRSNQAWLESKETQGMTTLLSSTTPLRKRPFYNHWELRDILNLILKV